MPLLTLDFETEGIVGNPLYAPPKPVGFSLKWGADGSKYYGWGHPTKNNCTWAVAKAALLKALYAADFDQGWIAQNAPFELAVLRVYFGYKPRDYMKVHDTQFLIFLHDPYAYTFSLKPSAERILGIPPDEQDELRDWILRHIAAATLSNWGAYIALAPGDLVGKYAGHSSITGVPGDTDRTWLLFDHLLPRIEERGMLPAYQREQKLSPILARSSQHGVRLDAERLDKDIVKLEKALKKSEDYIHGVLGDFNIDSNVDFAAALERSGMVDDWVLTPTGKRSTARKNLVGRVKDPHLLEYLSYRGVLSTCLGTFAKPWAEQARTEGGRVHPQWNQVRGAKSSDGDMSGTRTGRMSCREPNLQNIISNDTLDEIVVPKGLPPLPRMRGYMLPEEGHVWLKRDFAAQEMRILAHFTEGKLYDAFKADPNTDPHAAVKQIILDNTGIDLIRKHVKITGFGIIYGRGIPNLSAALGVDVVQGQRTRDAYFAALPEVKSLSRETSSRGRANEPIRTWGGRCYFREPDHTRDLSYKLLNYLIQGSGADQTKDTIIEWDAKRKPTDTFLAAVHDDINISAPVGDAKGAMKRLRDEMNADRFDVPFRSDGYKGPNGADLEKWE